MLQLSNQVKSEKWKTKSFRAFFGKLKGFGTGVSDPFFILKWGSEKAQKRAKKNSVAHLGVPHCFNCLIIKAARGVLTKFQISLKCTLGQLIMNQEFGAILPPL